MNVTGLLPDTLDRMTRAVDSVRERVLRAARVLEDAGIPYAVVGGNAVGAWVSQIDPGAVRNTRDVDILVRRSDFPAVRAAMEAAGLTYHQVLGVDAFLDGPDARPSESIHLLYANEPVRPDHPVPSPDVTDTIRNADFRVVSLQGLVGMKLVSWRLKDRVHLQDMVRVGLIDATWPDRFPPPLAERLREIISDPDG